MGPRPPSYGPNARRAANRRPRPPALRAPRAPPPGVETRRRAPESPSLVETCQQRPAPQRLRPLELPGRRQRLELQQVNGCHPGFESKPLTIGHHSSRRRTQRTSQRPQRAAQTRQRARIEDVWPQGRGHDTTRVPPRIERHPAQQRPRSSALGGRDDLAIHFRLQFTQYAHPKHAKARVTATVVCRQRSSGYPSRAEPTLAPPFCGTSPALSWTRDVALNVAPRTERQSFHTISHASPYYGWLGCGRGPWHRPWFPTRLRSPTGGGPPPASSPDPGNRQNASVRIERSRDNVFTVTATSQELSTLVAGARMALEAMRGAPEPPPKEAVEILERVLDDFDRARERLAGGTAAGD